MQPAESNVALHAAAPRLSLGDRLRLWRAKRGLSQMALALAAGVSPRHLSFVENGRSKPSPELVVELARQLDLGLRDSNELMLAAGYAPRHSETSLAAPEMASVRAAVERMLDAHDPFPGVAMDRRWNIVHGNRAAMRLLQLLPPALARPPVNLLRASLHPEGFASKTENFDAWGRHLVDALDRLAAASLDPDLEALRGEVGGYDNVRAMLRRSRLSAAAITTDNLLLPCVMRIGGARLSLFTTLVSLSTPLDVTLSELKIELFYPADEATAATLRAAA